MKAGWWRWSPHALGFSRSNPHCIPYPLPPLILSPPYISIPFICISSKKMKSWTHPASPQTHKVKFQLVLNKTSLYAITIHPLTSKTLSTTQKTKLGLLPLPAFLFDKGFTISKLKSLPSRETLTDNWNGTLLCCPLGHLNVSDTIHLKHHIPNIKFL